MLTRLARPLTVLGFSLTVTCLLVRPVSACSYAPFTVHQVTTQDGSAAPAQVKDVNFTVQRGKGPEGSGCSQSTSSCDDQGTLAVHWATCPATRSASGCTGKTAQTMTRKCCPSR